MRIFQNLRLSRRDNLLPGTAAQPGFSGTQVVDEHFVPSAGLDIQRYVDSGDLTAVHHIARYLWASRVISEAPVVELVLDLGCGSGYGTFTLAQSRPDTKFLGIDYDQRAIAAASENYACGNLTFKVGDPADWKASIGDQVYQVITCFDVLEHVLHRDLLLEGVVQHLDEDGCLLFSTPCGSPENILRPDWEHHRIEFSAASLYDLIGRYFGAIARPEEPNFPGREIFEQLRAQGIEYLLRMNPIICRHPIRLPNPYRRSP